MIKIYIDAATNQTKQMSAGGMIILKNKNQKQLHFPLLAKTNNEAEFEMFVLALNYSLDQKWTNEMLFIYTDSRIVTDSIQKKYVKDELFKPHLEKILALIRSFDLLFIEWIDEKDNKGADHLAKQALQKKDSN